MDNKKYFLDLNGLQTLWTKMKGVFASQTDVNAIGSEISTIKTNLNVLQQDIDGVESLTLSYAPKVADNYSAAVMLAATVPAGTIIVVGTEETIGDKVYKDGFYIVDNDKSVHFIGITTGVDDTDAVAELRRDVDNLQKQIITSSSITDENGNALGGFTIANNSLIAIYDNAVVANSQSVNAITHRAVAAKFGELEAMLSSIPKFTITVVDKLPESDISLSTIYLVKSVEGDSDNLYVEYIYIQNKGWEKLGEQKIALDNYVTKDFLTNTLNAAVKDLASKTYVDTTVGTTKTEILNTVADTYATKNEIAGLTTEAAILESIQSGVIGEAIAITDAQIIDKLN